MPSTLQHEHVENMAAGVELVRAGFRPRIVEVYTSLSRRLICKWWWEIHGVGPEVGPLPSGPSILRSLVYRRDAAIFLNLYAEVNEGGSLDIQSVQSAYRQYTDHREANGQAPLLSITDGWVLARDVEVGTITAVRCASCHQHHYLAINQRASSQCPFCRRGTRDRDAITEESACH